MALETPNRQAPTARRPPLPSSAYGGRLLAWTLLATSDVLEVMMKERVVQPWYQTPYVERNGEISPDGRWVAYEASHPAQSVQFNVYVRPFADPKAALVPVSTGGGRQPAWSRDGNEVFYVAPDGTLYGVRVESVASGTTLVAHTARRIPGVRYYHGIPAGAYASRMYDVSRDGRFLMIKEAAADSSTSRASIIVVQNWLEELKRLVPLP